MAQYKKYDVIMKILDIVEKDTITGEQNQKKYRYRKNRKNRNWRQI